MDEKDPRPYQAIGVDMASSESGRARFVKDGVYTPPPTSTWRCNLTALSQRYNLYFVASKSGIAVYTPQFPFQKLGRKPKLYIPPTLADPTGPGYIDKRDPHGINHLIVGDLGTEEILLVATDSGNVTAYHTKAIHEAVKNDPYRFSNEARSDFAGLRPFFSQCVHESAWGLAIHTSARMIAVSANVQRQVRHATSESFPTVTVFAFALSDDIEEDGAPESSASDGSSVNETDWKDWVPREATSAAPTRNHNYRVVLTGLSGHRCNIPSISFVNTSQDLQGLWLLSTDILGYMKMWQVWSGTAFRTWHFGTEELFGYQPLDDEAGWLVAALDPKSFHLARTTAQFCGHRSVSQMQGQIQPGRESYDLTTIVRLTVPGRSHRHPFMEPGVESTDSSDGSSADEPADDGDIVADHYSEDESSPPESSESGPTSTAIDANPDDTDARSTDSGVLPAPEEPSTDASRDVEDILLDHYDSNVEESEEDFENDSDVGDVDSHEGGEEELDGSDGNDERSTSPVSFASETSLSHVTQRSSVEVEMEPLSITSPRSRASPTGSTKAVNAKKRARKDKQSRDTWSALAAIPTLHCTTNNLRLLNAPREREAHLFCGNVLEQRLPHARIWRQASSMRRLNMMQQIPDLGIVIIASQFGRCAICALTRHQNTRTYGLRVDWIVPTKRQEKSGERPGLWLLGIATAPVQGQEIEDPSADLEQAWGDTAGVDDPTVSFDPRIVALPNREEANTDSDDDDDADNSAQKRRRRGSSDAEDSPSEGSTVHRSWKRPIGTASRIAPTKGRRYRLMMTYADHTVLTYEISRDFDREDSDLAALIEC